MINKKQLDILENNSRYLKKNYFNPYGYNLETGKIINEDHNKIKSIEHFGRVNKKI